MSLELAITKLAEAIESQNKVFAALVGAKATSAPEANVDAAEDAAKAEADQKAKAAADQKAKAAADQKAKAAADRKAKADADKKAKADAEAEAEAATAAADDDDDDLLGSDLEEETFTLEQVRDAMQEAMASSKENGDDCYKQMRKAMSDTLKEHKAAKVSDLKPESFAAVMKAISDAKEELL